MLASVADTGAVAVLADAYPLNGLEELRRALAPVPMLRPVFTRRPGKHAGGPEDEFACYARLGPNGEFREIADGNTMNDLM